MSFLDRFTGTTLSLQTKAQQTLQPLNSRGSWWPVIRESFSGAWQRNVDINVDTVLTFHAVYACISLIAGDISKMCLRLVAEDENGIWEPVESAAFSPVLRKPNRYQNRIKFFEWWMTSKLINGNTYALKQRDQRGVVTALYILDPMRVTPLVAPDGAVFYQLKRDDLSGIPDDDLIKNTVPAKEIIHDIMCALYHPLIGVSPIHACGLAALQGLKIQNNSYKFFANGSVPGMVVTVPGQIKQEQADAIKAAWDLNFGGDNFGKVAVLSDGMTAEGLKISNVDAQLIEQLKWTAEVVCSVFHVPPYMIGVGPPPNYNNIEALNQQYYQQALQHPVESIELCLDEGLELPKPYGTEFDLDDLLRMDTAAMIDSEGKAVGAGIKAPNESRKRMNLKPKQGGDTPYLQQQNYSLAALDRRDQTPAPATNVQPVPPLDDEPQADLAASFGEALHRKMIERQLYAAWR
jgi:HK97 family phage portal protein